MSVPLNYNARPVHLYVVCDMSGCNQVRVMGFYQRCSPQMEQIDLGHRVSVLAQNRHCSELAHHGGLRATRKISALVFLLGYREWFIALC